MKRKLLIDGQIFQTAARHRGMGRYSLSFLQALAGQEHGYASIEVILNNNLNDRYELPELENVTFRKLELSVSGGHLNAALSSNREVLSNYVEKQKAQNYEIDFLILSLFQEPVAATFPEGARKLLLFYDLVPYLYHKRYETAIPFDDYLKRFKGIFEADLIFTISQTVADDLSVYLGIPKDKLVRIDGAAIRADQPSTRPDIALPEQFILMPTSDDLRKNNLGAVLGFEEFLKSSDDHDHKLVITSTIAPKERLRLESASDNLIFTDNLREEEIDWLYENCTAVLFVPEYEGLGLPVLEAVAAGKKAACSTLGVFKEISETAFSYCDHEDTSSIAYAVTQAIKPGRLPKEYANINAHYTWSRTAERFLKGLRAPSSPRLPHKPRIAIFTPVPDGFSAIGKVVAESHPVMSRHFEIDYFADPGLHPAGVRPNYLQYVAPYRSAASFGVKDYEAYDAVIYHIGNGDYHLESIKNGLYLPGYGITHDTNISEAYRVLGESGMMSKDRIALEKKLDEVAGPDRKANGLTSLLNVQLGIMTHSDYAADAIKEMTEAGAPIVAADLPTAVAELPAYRREDRVTIGLAGIIADIKGIEVIESLAKQPEFSDCRIMIFGFSHATPETIDRLNSYPNVTVETGLTDFEFNNNLTKLNIYVNYRLGYQGETSLSTIEAMRNSVAVVVRDIGWYGELPDDIVVKVGDADEVTERLKALVKDPVKVRKIGEAARRHIKGSFSHEQYAQALMALVGQSKPASLNGRLAERLRTGKIKDAKQYIGFLRDNT